MRVLCVIREVRLRAGSAGLGCLLAWGMALGAKPGAPVVTVPLEPLGFTGFPIQYLMSGWTMYTVHFVDATHVLFTFNAKTLMARLPDATAEDQDRTVAAVLMELPTGKVLAKTIWRTRDRERYLWSLGHGRFLLRVRTKLTLIDPMKGLEEGNAFKERLFLDLKRPIGFISVSAGGDLLTVETVPRAKRKEGDVTLGGEDDLSEEAAAIERKVPVQIHFYRLGAGKEMDPAYAGVVYSPALVNVPATAEGFLDVKKEAGPTWDFDFRSHAGKVQELSAFDTSCAPRPYFVSRSEFVAFGCLGAGGKSSLSGFNLRGEEPWIATYGDNALAPQIVTAPAGGRFALGRVVLSGQFVDPDNLTADMVTGEEVNVLQTHDGRSVMKLMVSPAQRTGQNFDLSEDGLEMVTVRAGNLEVYKLGDLTAKDKNEIARATEAEPAKNTAEIALDSMPVVRKAEAKAEGVKVGAEVMQKSAGEVVGEEGNVVGDVPVGKRKVPSLYDADHPKPQ